MTYSFPAHIFPDETTFGVEFPDVPGCYTYGDTIEEALHYAVEALGGHLESLLDIGQELPEPSTEIVHLQPGDIYAVITCEVKTAGMRSAG